MLHPWAYIYVEYDNNTVVRMALPMIPFFVHQGFYTIDVSVGNFGDRNDLRRFRTFL